MNYRRILDECSKYPEMFRGLRIGELLNYPLFLDVVPTLFGPDELRSSTQYVREWKPFDQFCIDSTDRDEGVRLIAWVNVARDACVIISAVLSERGTALVRSDVNLESGMGSAFHVTYSAVRPEIADDDTYKALIATICQCLNTINSSSNSVVLQRGRNLNHAQVKWRMTREHYLVLSKNKAKQHVANSGGTATIAQINRGAHARRGHKRFYRNSKYGEKVGKLMCFVSDSWVGPSSFKGTDSKIYLVRSDRSKREEGALS